MHLIIKAKAITAACFAVLRTNQGGAGPNPAPASAPSPSPAPPPSSAPTVESVHRPLFDGLPAGVAGSSKSLVLQVIAPNKKEFGNIAGRSSGCFTRRSMQAAHACARDRLTKDGVVKPGAASSATRAIPTAATTALRSRCARAALALRYTHAGLRGAGAVGSPRRRRQFPLLISPLLLSLCRRHPF